MTQNAIFFLRTNALAPEGKKEKKAKKEEKRAKKEDGSFFLFFNRKKDRPIIFFGALMLFQVVWGNADLSVSLYQISIRYQLTKRLPI